MDTWERINVGFGTGSAEPAGSTTKELIWRYWLVCVPYSESCKSHFSSQLVICSIRLLDSQRDNNTVLKLDMLH
jgi:hypothetical protein